MTVWIQKYDSPQIFVLGNTDISSSEIIRQWNPEWVTLRVCSKETKQQTLARYPRPVMSPRDRWSGPSASPLWRCAWLQTHWRNRRLSQESSSVVECHIATLAQLCFCQQLLLSLWLHNASLLSRTASARREGGSPLKQQETAAVGAGLHHSVARNEKTLLSSMWMTDITTAIKYYPRIAIWQQQAQSCPRTRKITRHPRNQSKKKGTILTSTSLAVVCSAPLLRWFHHKRSAGAKAPFQVKMSNFSSVTEEGTPINY